MSGHGHGAAQGQSHAHGAASHGHGATNASHAHGPSAGQSLSHGHGHGGSSAAAEKKDEKKEKEKEKEKSPAWPIFKKSIPYLWPRDSMWLRFCFISSLVCLLIGSLADLYTPVATKYAVDELSGNVDEGIEPRLPVRWILLYGVIRFAANLFQQMRDAFFAAVGAETERRVALETFHHLQSLSLSFHLQRETGSVLRSLSRGAQSFATLSRIVLFQIAPIFVQLAVVCIYLATLYPWYFALLTFGIIALYFAFTLTTTNWRDRYRRVMNEKDNEFNQKSVDALLNFETVKYFNAEAHEERRYDVALTAYTLANTRTQQSLAVLNAGQNLIISFGIALALFLAAREVINEHMTVGDFVMVQAFILQLYSPLGFLGTYYRMIKQNLVDVESMFKILAEQKDISDQPNARALQAGKGEVTFENVSFAYDKKVPILKNVSFTVRPGMKVAIVGQSGAGKSTIARLLYRFYDVTGGRILVDGQDIRQVTQVSLRAAIAIIPQDTVLFNDTLAYNVGYGAYARSIDGASKAEIEDATQRAALDGFIGRQPDGYDTKVGERGLRLSGGEKQRVSIARAILKRSSIMIFDEATSALDTQTEVEIQRELDAVSQGRSSITIAHRLSTIANSDLIIVLDAGRIVEQGRHDELLKLGGLYSRMWLRQERARELKGELEQLTEAEKAEKERKAEEVRHSREAAMEEESKLGERKEASGGSDSARTVGGGGNVMLDVRDEVEVEEEEAVEVENAKAKRKKKGKGGDDLGAPLLG